jgi:hypothetical protein
MQAQYRRNLGHHVKDWESRTVNDSYIEMRVMVLGKEGRNKGGKEEERNLEEGRKLLKGRDDLVRYLE